MAAYQAQRVDMSSPSRVIPYPLVGRPSGQAPPGQAIGSPPSDPVKLAALEQLLRTIAERAQAMTTQEILALSAAFSVASSSSTCPAQLPIPPAPPAPSVVGGSVTLFNPGATASVSLEEKALGPLPNLEEVAGGLNTVKVSARTNVKSIAGAVSKSLRNNEMIVATAYGPDGANHGMKALSIARCYLAADGWDLSATVVEVLPDPAMNGPGRCFAFIVVRIQVPAKVGEPLCEAGVGRTEPLPRFVRPEGQQTDMKVSGAGNAQSLAGAISKCLREDREIIVTAVGPASVAKCVEAMAMARSYVWNDGLQLAFFPGFEHIIMQGTGPGAGEQRCCLRVHVWPEVAHSDHAQMSGGSSMQFTPQ